MPARSDLIALSLSATIAALLLAGLRASSEPVLSVFLFGALPFVPVIAAVASGPAHSFRSRFRFRGTAAIAGMASAVLAFASLGDSYDVGRPLLIVGGAIWAFTFSVLAYLVVLTVHILLGRDGDALES